MKCQWVKLNRRKLEIFKEKKEKSIRFRRNELKRRKIKTADAFTPAEGIHYKSGSFHQQKLICFRQM